MEKNVSKKQKYIIKHIFLGQDSKCNFKGAKFFDKVFLTDDHSEKVSKNKKRVGPCFQICKLEEATFGDNTNFHTVTFVNDVTFFRS